MTTVGVAIPSIPIRNLMLCRALASVCEQIRVPDRISVVVDYGREGAAATRNKAWRALGDVDFVAFLDDDDLLYPNHLATLLAAAEETGAALVYSWFDLLEGDDPLYVNGERAENRPFDDVARNWILNTGNFIPITVLLRREALEKVDGFPQPRSERWPHETNEDWACWQQLLLAGFTFHHVPMRSWRWVWHGANVEGRPDRW